MAPPRPALFLDRDGVINEERDHLHDPEQVELIAGVGAAIAAFNRRGIPVVVVSNQAGIGRGLYGEADWRAVNARIAALIATDGARIDAWYCCAHDAATGCPCRKPAPGMLRAAGAALGLDLSRSILVGDKESDLGAARTAGCRAVLVRTGYGRAVERELLARGAAARSFDRCCDSLADLAAPSGIALDTWTLLTMVGP